MMGALMREPILAFSCDDISPRTEVTKLRGVLRTADRFDVNVTLFVIPKSEAHWSSCSSLVKALKDAQSCGHEIGLHGLNHFIFETGNPFNALGFGYSSIKTRILNGLRVVNEKLGINPRGYRAPYHHCSQGLWRVLEDLNFLYDSSKMDLSSVLVSYVPPLRAVYLKRKRGLSVSKMFHPLNLKLWEIPVAQEYTWYNLEFEVRQFETFLKNNILKIGTGCFVVNSHISALSKWGLDILKELFLYVNESALSKLTLQEIAERYTSLEAAKA